MALTNLGELKASIADWINREDLTSVIPEFIKIAEVRINDDHRSNVASNEVALEAGLPFALQQNPVDLGLGDILVGEVETVIVNGNVIPYVTLETYNKEKKESTYKDGCYTVREGQVFYSGFAEPYEAAPTSGDDVDFRLYYNNNDSKFDLANDSSTTPFFLENPSAYLYAALVEASVYLRDMEGVQIYQARYDELMDKVFKAFKRSKVSGGMSVGSVGGDNYFDRSY